MSQPHSPPSPLPLAFVVLLSLPSLSFVACAAGEGVQPNETASVSPEATVAGAEAQRVEPKRASPASPLDTLLAAAVTTAPAAPADPGGAAEPLQVELGRCWKGGCELEFRFSHDMVDPEDLPTQAPVRVTFDPPQAGRFQWRQARTLVFAPAAGALPWGQRLRVVMHYAQALDGAAAPLQLPWERLLQVPFFAAANKVAEWPVQAGCPRLVAPLGAPGVERVGRGPLYLLYDQPVRPAALAPRLLALLPNGRQLPTRVFRPTDVAAVYGGELDLSHVVAMELTRPPLDGKAVLLRLATCSDRGTPETLEREVEARSSFVLARHEIPHGRLALSSQVVLRFNNPVSTRALREHVRLEPAPRSLWIDGSGNTHTLFLQLEAGTRYQLSLRPGLRDLYGNPLRDTLSETFKTVDLPPSLQAPTQTVLLERGAAALPVQATNVGRLRLQGSHFESPAAYVQALRAGGGGDCMQLAAGDALPAVQGARASGPLNEASRRELVLPATLGSLLACVRVSGPARGGSAAETAVSGAFPVQVTGLGITTKVGAGRILAWITRLADATPMPGVGVTLLDAEGGALSTARSDEAGVAWLPAEGLAQARGLVRPVFVMAETDDDRAVVPVRPGQLAEPWQFGLQTVAAGDEALPAALLSERGVYRPGESVHLLSFLRAPAGAAADNLPPLELSVRDARGRPVHESTLHPDRFGAAHVELPLGREAAVGQYVATVAHGGRSSLHRFRVEEYRVPSFRVALGDAAQVWEHRRRANVRVAASYLRGGELAGRSVDYRISREPATFAPPGYAGYIFVGDAAAGVDGGLGQGSERLDGQGHCAVQFIPDHPSEQGPARYLLEATVQDVDRQTITARRRQTVHPSSFYLGVRPPPRGVLVAGQRIELPVVAVRPDGRPAEGVAVEAVLERVEHHTARRLVRPGQVQHVQHTVHRAVHEQRLRTRATARTLKLRIPKAGQYRLVLRARDRKGRKVATVLPLVAGGAQPSPWPRYDHERIDVLADRSSYVPGDTARLIVASPFAQATGLLTLERGGVLEHRLVHWRRDTPVIEVPITADMVPNLYVSVAVLRGRVHRKRDAAGLDPGAPTFRLGYAELAVRPAEQQLEVAVRPEHEHLAPGSELGVQLQVRGADGAPVAGQAAVLVVDEAVLALTGYRTPTLLSELYPKQGLGVLTSASLLDLPGSRQARHEQVFPGGDGSDGSEPERAPLGPLGDGALRSVFRSTAWVDAAVPLDEQGQATVRFTLPDNLTSYRIMVLAVDGRGRAGSGDATVALRRPLMVQPVVPRFLHPGDRLVVGAIVQNGTATSGDVQLQATLEGLRAEGPTTVALGSMAGGATGRGDFAVEVTGRQEAVLRLDARMGAHRDSVRVVVPIRDPGVRRRAVSTRTVAGRGEVSVELPAERQPGSGRVEVVVSTTRLNEMSDAVDYLMGYPNGCIEQTTSRAYPLVVLEDLLPELGVEVDRKKLREYSEAGVKRLLGFQTEAGGLSYWPGGSKAHAFGTAFGLTALIAARNKGYDVPADALGRMADYLLQQLRSRRIEERTAHGDVADGDTRAFIAMTLNRLQRPQPAYIEALWRERAKLSPFGLAFLAIAVQEGGGPEALLDPLLGALADAAEQNADSAWYGGERRGGASMDSPLRSHAGALLAHAVGGRDRALTPKLLQGLLQRRRGGLWGNTQENVFGVMAVTRLVAGGDGDGGGPAFELRLGERTLRPGDMEAVSERMHRIRVPEDALKLAAGRSAQAVVQVAAGAGAPLHVTVRAEYDLKLSDELRAPRAEGLVLERRYETRDGRSLEGRPIPLGSLVRVRLRLSSKQERSYVALADHLPAGLEPLNTHLQTSAPAEAGPATAPVLRGLAALSYDELRDHRVAFYADALPAGTVEYVYLARATTPGTFLRPAADAEAMYEPEVSAATAIDEVVVR